MNFITVRGDAVDAVAIDFEKAKNGRSTYYGRGNRT